MKTLDQLRTIAKEENTIFYKTGCPFCAASEKLFNKLQENGIINSFNIYYLYQDFNDEQLTELVTEYGWESTSQYQLNCTKPQIFIKGDYVGGNFELHKSKWNIGDTGSGLLLVNGEEKNTPMLKNPMRF
ncbi:MAG: glutaredoxin [Patescibacteria group bacterium]